MAKTTIFTFLKGVPEDVRMGGQKRAILEAIADAGEIDRASLLEAVSQHPDFTKSDQPASRILTYHMRTLKNEGYISVEKSTESEEPAAEAA